MLRKGIIWVGFCPKCETRCSHQTTQIKPYLHIICKKCLNKNPENIIYNTIKTITPEDYSFVLKKEEQLKTYCFDLDGTLCSKEKYYVDAKPMKERIEIVNKLYDKGHPIIILTARGMGLGLDYKELTENQLKKWGLKYDKLYLTKPPADFYIDDKAIKDFEFFEND